MIPQPVILFLPWLAGALATWQFGHFSHTSTHSTLTRPGAAAAPGDRH
jgi:hypothetical protein